MKQEGLEALDLHRRFVYQKRFLERVLASGPQPEVAWDPEAVSRSVDAISELGRRGSKLGSRSEKLLSTVLRETNDEWIRKQCAVGLAKLGAVPPAGLASLHRASPADPGAASLEVGKFLAGAK